MSSSSSAIIYVGWEDHDFMSINKVEEVTVNWEEDDKEDLYEVSSYFELDYSIIYDSCENYVVGKCVKSVDWGYTEITPEDFNKIREVVQELHGIFGVEPKIYLCSSYF